MLRRIAKTSSHVVNQVITAKKLFIISLPPMIAGRTVSLKEIAGLTH
jgi:hypothetical protein